MTERQPPPITPPARAALELARAGFAVLDAAGVLAATGIAPTRPGAWARAWDDLPPDTYLRDGGRYRRRRHGSFRVGAETCARVPHRAHWQGVAYNALHGGIERWYEPLPEALAADEDFARLVAGLGRVFARVRAADPWFVEAHTFRIDTTDGIGRPTPEGAHRDGVDFVAVLLVARQGILGGETRVFEADGPRGVRFTLEEPWSALLLDDTRVIHESTPIRPAGGGDAHRDTLVLTYRAGGFQEPDARAT